LKNGEEEAMKKTAVVMFLILALALLSACAQMTSTGGSQRVSPVLDRIVQRGELVVGTSGEQPPLTVKNKGGKIIGLDADLARRMANAMEVKLRFEVMPFPELLPALEAGKIDMILSGMTMTPKRNLKVAFIGPYYVSGKGILTKIRTVASMKDASEMNRPDFALAALKDSTSQRFVEQVIPRAKLVTPNSLDEAVDKVIRGEVEAMVADYPVCAVSALRHPGKGLAVGGVRFTVEPLGIALPANDPLLVNWVDNFLQVLEGTGALPKLYERWFKDGSWLKDLP
jgi:polar amino acid transport system substrate-binding protein